MKITEEVIRIGLTALADNNLRDLHNSSENTKAKFNNCFIIHSKIILVQKQAKTCLPSSMLSSSSIVHVNRQV